MTAPDTLTIGGARYKKVRQSTRAVHACDGCAAQRSRSRYNDRLCAILGLHCLPLYIYVRSKR